MKKIVIINCGGNILSLVRAINKFNFQVNVTNNAKEIEEASHIFLPGVGAFKNAMRKLEEFNLINFLRSLDYKKKNLMGICLGMQILMEQGEEDGYHEGLKLIDGKVKKIILNKEHRNNKFKIPNIGWHKLVKNKSWKNTILENSINTYCYFVHSYYVEVRDKIHQISHINYGDIIIPAVIKKNQIYGCQFHPEKSGEKGLEIIKNFLEKN